MPSSGSTRPPDGQHHAFARVAWGEQRVAATETNPRKTPVRTVFHRPVVRRQYLSQSVTQRGLMWRWNLRQQNGQRAAGGRADFFRVRLPQDPTSDATKPTSILGDHYFDGNQRGCNKRALRTIQIVNNFQPGQRQRISPSSARICGSSVTMMFSWIGVRHQRDAVRQIRTQASTWWIRRLRHPRRHEHRRSIGRRLRAEHRLPPLGVRADRAGLRVAGQRRTVRAGPCSISTRTIPRSTSSPRIRGGCKPNLTMDLGVRWELKLHPNNPDGLIRAPAAAWPRGRAGPAAWCGSRSPSTATT